MTERADPPVNALRPHPGSQPDQQTWPAVPHAAAAAGRALAIASYLSAAVAGFLPPLAIYLLQGRHSPFVRRHAAQAANAAITFLLYLICAAVIGGALALSSVSAGLWTAATVALLLWIAMAGYLTRAALAARSGTFFRMPDWLCAPLLRPGR